MSGFSIDDYAHGEMESQKYYSDLHVPSEDDIKLINKIIKNSNILELNKDEEVEFLANAEDIIHFRESANYEDKSSEFSIKNINYINQYSSLYFSRLTKLYNAVQRNALRNWSNTLNNVIENEERQLDHPKSTNITACSHIRDLVIGEKSAVIGTVYKDMKLKRSVLQEYIDETFSKEDIVFVSDSDVLPEYTSLTDKLYLEDFTSRTILGGIASTLINSFVSGMVIACLGILRAEGIFEVHSICFADLPKLEKERLKFLVKPQIIPRFSLPSLQSYPSKYVAFVSGLHVGEPQCNPLHLDKLLQFISGKSGCCAENNLSGSIVRLVVIGNSLTASFNDPSSLDESDIFFCSLSSSLPTDIMPGAGDPTNYSLPQNPLHPALFKHAKYYRNFRSTTNPYKFEVDGVRFFGSSGQCVADICSYTDLKDLEALEMMARCRCIAPTSPDTLPCAPFSDHDPFCFDDDDFPDVIFSGNNSTFQYKYIGGEDDKNYIEVKYGIKLSSPSDIEYQVNNNDVVDISTNTKDLLRDKICVLLCIPKFTTDARLVLVDLDTLNIIDVDLS